MSYFTETLNFILNESKDKISYSKSFNDVKNIVDTLPRKELLYICNGDFKNSPYVKYRKVIKENDDPVAFIDIYTLPDMNKDSGAVVIACKKKYRNKGYSSMLLKSAKKWAKDNGINLIYSVKKVNVSSRNLGKKHGFYIDDEDSCPDDTIEYHL